MFFRRTIDIVVTVWALWTLSFVGAKAHFLLNLNVRIIHVEHVNDGLHVYLRLPMPYLVADKLGEAPGGELPDPAPFTTNSLKGEALVHYVDFEAIADDAETLAMLVGNGHSISTAQEDELTPEFRALRVHHVGNQPGFATLAEAKAVMGQEPQMHPADTVFVGDAVVDVELFYPATAVSNYTISSNLDPGLPGQEDTANLILDYGTGTPQVFRSRGLMEQPLGVSSSKWDAAATFVWEGVRHILEGIDHVLFVICLVISARMMSALLTRVTGFTVGHSVTLTMGFFGLVPSGAWFVPAVEAGIALSIVYAALLAIWPRFAGEGGNQKMLVITAAIGLLHGLGFSFVLQKILQVDAPNIWQSLLAFNVGVEIGQVAIVLLVWPTLLLLKKLNVWAWTTVRFGLAAACMAMALFWTVERMGQVVASL
ncbi:MAG: HupE/UreJ family protein [Paracoccaceae bacterium]